MTDLVALAEALRSRLPADALSFDPDARYAVDGLRPAFVVSPSAPEDVATVLAIAQESGAAVVPFGAGTQMALGMPPERYDLALDLRRLDRVVEYEPADLTVTVEAGIRLDELQRRLGEHGQWLPLDLPHVTVGGLLATNASGPARHAHGTARDLVIGMTVVLADGSLVKSGGRVVKNVAGYDMAKLHIGALGTLGVIVQASFKVAPLPQSNASVVLRGPLSNIMSIDARLRTLRLAGLGTALAKDASSPDWRLIVGFAGGEAAVERSQRELAAIAPAAVAESAWRTLGRSLDASLLVRASVLTTATASVCEALASLRANVLAYPSVGVVYGAWADAGAVTPEALIDLRRRCVAAGGALVLERAAADLKRHVDVWGAPRADFSLMLRLKEELDPRRVLNPGRYLGGL